MRIYHFLLEKDVQPLCEKIYEIIITENDLKVQKLTESEINDSTNEKSSGEINIVENKVINDVYDDEDIIDISQLKGKEVWHYSMLEKFFIVSKSAPSANISMLILFFRLFIFLSILIFFYNKLNCLCKTFCSKNLRNWAFFIIAPINKN